RSAARAARAMTLRAIPLAVPLCAAPHEARHGGWCVTCRSFECWILVGRGAQYVLSASVARNLRRCAPPVNDSPDPPLLSSYCAARPSLAFWFRPSGSEISGATLPVFAAFRRAGGGGPGDAECTEPV